MPQGVGVGRDRRPTVEDPAGRPRAQSGSPRFKKTASIGALGAGQHLTPLGQPHTEGRSALRSWMGTRRCLVALAPHRDRPPAEVHPGPVERAELGHPQPGGVEQLEQGVVAPGQGHLGTEAPAAGRRAGSRSAASSAAESTVGVGPWPRGPRAGGPGRELDSPRRWHQAK